MAMQEKSTEDYIKAIYALETERRKVTTSALARRLHLRDASVTYMLKRLSARNLIHYEKYRGVHLKTAGRHLALRILRRHRLWEMFLARYLQFPWERVHDEAERLEHVTSDEVEQRLDRILGYPKTDPHGDPIPSASGGIAVPRESPLSDCPPGAEVSVRRVSDRDPEILTHATRIGLRLGTKVKVMEKVSFDGSLTVRIRSRRRFLSRELASAIFVKRG